MIYIFLEIIKLYMCSCLSCVLIMPLRRLCPRRNNTANNDEEETPIMVVNDDAAAADAEEGAHQRRRDARLLIRASVRRGSQLALLHSHGAAQLRRVGTHRSAARRA